LQGGVGREALADVARPGVADDVVVQAAGHVGNCFTTIRISLLLLFLLLLILLSLFKDETITI